MRKDILIGIIIRGFSIPKIFFYKIFFAANIPFGSIIFGYPKIRYGGQINIGKGFQIGRLCRLSGKISIGKNFFMNEFGTISAGSNNNGKITIGDNVLIGPLFYMIAGDHGIGVGENFNTSNSGKHSDINIGNNVWIGARVTLLKGVSIGNNSVIGAGSVITKNIPDNCVAVGNPCKKIKDII